MVGAAPDKVEDVRSLVVGRDEEVDDGQVRQRFVPALLLVSLATPITISGPEDIQSRKHWSELLEPYEHQIRNLLTFCRRAPVALIADDVGLGKTISAGLI